MGSLNSNKNIEAFVNKIGFNITLDMAKKVALGVEKKAKEIGVNAVVAISDSGANPVLVECMDNSFIASYDIAVNKAYTCVALKMSTQTLKTMTSPGQSLYGIQFTNNGKIVIFGGGDPLKIGEKIIGAIGVSGGSEEQDTFLSAYGREYFEKLYSEEMK